MKEKVILFSKDALPANAATIAREQHAFHVQNALDWAANLDFHTLSMGIDCIHHQGSLARLHGNNFTDLLCFVLGRGSKTVFCATGVWPLELISAHELACLHNVRKPRMLYFPNAARWEAEVLWLDMRPEFSVLAENTT